MSRFLTNNKDGTYLEEIESMQICKWRINDVCCNDSCDCLGDYPYPRSICELENDGKNWACGCFEKEDGIIEGRKTNDRGRKESNRAFKNSSKRKNYNTFR